MRRCAPVLAVLLGVSAGCPHPEVELKVVRAPPQSVAMTSIGSVKVKGPSLPSTAFLNRFDLLEMQLDRELIPDGEFDSFVDYIRVKVSDGDNSHTIPAWAGDPGEQWELTSSFAKYFTRRSLAEPLELGAGYLIKINGSAKRRCGRGIECYVVTVSETDQAEEGRDKIPQTAFARIDGSLVPILDLVKLQGGRWEIVFSTEKVKTIPDQFEIFPRRRMSAPWFSFFHFSDVQVREAQAKLGDEAVSHALDKIINSFEHDFTQELYIDLVLRALVDTTNAVIDDLKDGERPRFVIHTGDAVDAGLHSELVTFHRTMDLLKVPWLSLIGNHDVLTFGNLLPGTSTWTEALLLGAMPKGLRGGWVLKTVSKAEFHVPTEIVQCKGCGDRLVARNGYGANFTDGFVAPHGDHVLDEARMLAACLGPRCAAASPTSSGPDPHTCKSQPDCRLTEMHGFDFTPTGHPARSGGYYSFDLIEQGKRIRHIVLNTTDYGDIDEWKNRPRQRGGEAGYVGAAQRAWLQQQLTAGPYMFVVYGHHPISTIRVDGGRAEVQRLLQAVAKDRRLLAYVSGHTHDHSVRLIGDHARGAFWEIQTASVISFPQEVRLVQIRKLSNEVGFLELLPYRHQVNLDEVTEYHRALKQADVGARRDYCAYHRCTPDGLPIRNDGQHRAVRLFFAFPSS